MVAILKSGGKMPVKVFMISVRAFGRVFAHSFNSIVGLGSSSYDLESYFSELFALNPQIWAEMLCKIDVETLYHRRYQIR